MTREGHQDQFGLQRYVFVLEQVWKAFSPEKGQSPHLLDHMTFKKNLAGISEDAQGHLTEKKPSRLLGGESIKQVIGL